MPSILYEGVYYVQTRHAVYCKKCKETIESKSLHDYVHCSCGALSIDGGISSGNRVCGSLYDMEDRSVYCYKKDKHSMKLYLPSYVLQNRIEHNKLFEV